MHVSSAFLISATGLCHGGLKGLSTQGCPVPLGIFPQFLHSVFLCPVICFRDGERHVLPVPGHKEHIETVPGNGLRALVSRTAGDGGIQGGISCPVFYLSPPRPEIA